MELPNVLKASYSTIRPFIKSGDILLCSGTAVFSRLIQHATESPWSHVGFLLRLDALERIVVLESVESIGVRACTLSSYVASYNGAPHGYPGRVYIARHRAFADVDAENLTHFSQGAVDLLGTPYDKGQILAVAARIVAAKLGMAPEPFVQNGLFICSEYCWHCFASVGIAIAYDVRGFVSPHDFAAAPEVEILWEIEVEHP